MKESNDSIFDNLVIVRGAGDLATATIIRLHNCGFPVIALEVEKPTVIRRTVSFAQAMFDGSATVEGVKAVRCEPSDVMSVLALNCIPVVADPKGSLIESLKPTVVVDAIIAKKNLGTSKSMAPFTVALGPGFTAGEDVDCVIETARGHRLARLIYEGTAAPNTGIPGNIEGFTSERVIHSPCSGVFTGCVSIGDIVRKGDVIAHVGEVPVPASLDGMVRGLLHDGLEVPEHFKIADIDPRGERADYLTCSDKARALSGSVLEAVMHYLSDNR
ncbi:MAG: EF2563 family selenium-dependent molybdenum hydroxylase system protein [Spirochaetales bacterium]|nr:EF2563 family selenium-dependent molybdenum hydroxylase system protein [Spirochaetales bacterium]